MLALQAYKKIIVLSPVETVLRDLFDLRSHQLVQSSLISGLQILKNFRFGITKFVQTRAEPRLRELCRV